MGTACSTVNWPTIEGLFVSIWKELISKFINIFDSSGDGAIGLEVLKQRVP